MIHLPIFRHVRRLIASAIIFGSTVMLMLWLPIRILKVIWPTFFPYTLSGDSEVNELSLQLLLLQIILPGFFEQSHTRIWLKGLLRIWCIAVSWVLGIHSYLLGSEQQGEQQENAEQAAAPDQEQQEAQPAAAAADIMAAAAAAAEEASEDEGIGAEEEEDNDNEHVHLLQEEDEEEDEEEEQEEAIADEVPVIVQPPPPPPPPAAGNLAMAHQALLQRDVLLNFQPYTRPSLFAFRLCCLMLIVGVSLVISSLVTLIVPVWIGRQIMALWSVGGLTTQVVTAHAVGPAEASPRPHELYTAALGTYLCWVVSRAIAITVNLLPLGRAAIMDKLKQWLRVAASYTLPVLIFVCMLSIISLLFGLLLELVVIMPLRVPLFQTPVFFLWQDWALGVLYTEIAIALALMGPDWHMKRALERAYRDGLRDIDLKFLIRDLAAPVVISLGLALAVPYVLTHTILTFFVKDLSSLMTISRIIYPLCFVVLVVIGYVYFEINQFKKLYVAIKVDKYLVGQRLVNYVDNKRKKEAEAAAKAAALIAAETAAATNNPGNDINSITKTTTTLAAVDSTAVTRDGVAFETIKEPVINAVELEMLEQLRREQPLLYYRQHHQQQQQQQQVPPQLNNDVAFGNDLL